MEQMAVHQGAHQLLFLPAPTSVFGITGQRDEVPRQVTATELLRLLVAEEAMSPQARITTNDALHIIILGPKKNMTAAALQSVDAFRASAIIHYRPHTTEICCSLSSIFQKKTLQTLCEGSALRQCQRQAIVNRTCLL